MSPPELSPHHGKDLGSADTIIGSDTVMADGTPVSSGSGGRPESLIGERIGRRYRVLRLLGSGGMGAVYLARDDELDEMVAIKVLRMDISSSMSAAELLRQEVRLARRVTHRNVARIFELGLHEGRRFLTMEYIDGSSLAALMRSGGRLPLERGIGILSAVAHGLQAAHDASVIHQDVKPDNVLVAKNGRVVISDFGIAQAVKCCGVSRETTPAGTPAYMAPEQLLGKDISTLTDVYALGVMGFEVLTGELPWRHIDSSRGRLHAPPPTPRLLVPDLPEPLAEVIVAAMASDPAARVPSPAEFADRLGAAVSTVRSTTRSGTGPYGKPTTSPRPGPGSHTKTSVVVLPFDNRGPAEDSFLASGFCEDLVDRMCTVSELKVLSSGVSMRFADDPREPHEIGRELGVSLVIHGSLQRTGGEVIVRVRAIAADDGTQHWANRYQVAPEELLTTSDEVASALVSSLELGQVARRHSAMPNAAAVEAYLKAKEIYRSARGRMDEMLVCYEIALAQAPDSPLVNAGYAQGLLRAWMILPRDDGSLAARARRAAEIAIASGAHLGEPHMALGAWHLHMGEPAIAVREFREAVALSPSMPDGHAFLGMLLCELGYLPEAMRRLDTASSLDPTMVMVNGDRRRVAALLGDWGRVEELTRGYTVTTPFGYLWSTRIASWRGDRQLLQDSFAGLKAMAATHPLESELTIGLLAVLDTYANGAPAQRVYDALSFTGRDPAVSCRRAALVQQLRAEVAGYAGDHDVAFESIRNAISVGLVDMLWLERCPLLQGPRSHPGYAALHADMKEGAMVVYDALWTPRS